MNRKYTAEFVGTFLLVFIAVGAAVSGLKSAGVIAVAVAFGFVLIFVAYAFGPVSGAHVNPAVTLAMVIARKQPIQEEREWASGCASSPARSSRPAC